MSWETEVVPIKKTSVTTSIKIKGPKLHIPAEVHIPVTCPSKRTVWPVRETSQVMHYVQHMQSCTFVIRSTKDGILCL